MRLLHWINIGMMVFGITLLATCLIKYYPIGLKAKFVKNILMKERDRMKRAVEHCETLALLEGESPSFEIATPDNPDFEVSWYQKLKSEIENYSYMFAQMTSHVNCSYGMSYFEKDAVSEEVLYGYECHAPIICHAHTVSINGNHYSYSGHRGYAVPKSDTLRIEYSMYSLSYDWDKIDTVVVYREVMVR